MKKENILKKEYLFWAVLAVIVVVTYFILKDFLVAFISAFILAYVLKPITDFLSKKINRRLASLITVILAALLIIAIITAISTSLIFQFSGFISEFSWEKALAIFSSFPYYENIANSLNEVTQKISQTLMTLIYSTITQVPALVINMLIIIFTTYYLLIDWKKIESKLIEIMPFENKKKLVADSEKIIREIVYGTLIVAIVEAIFAIICFYFLGLNFYLVLGILIGLLAFIPLLGPGLIWVPITLYEIAIKDYTKAAGVFIIGIIISFGIDFFLKMKILGNKTKIHPVIMLLGVLGGINLFGLMGFIIGPVIISILLTILSTIHKKK
ncbi:MAG TPA: AI-2E family transporter [Candidatus Paceibacterota bacterium]|nr:AI-2E family transporter [Candidatus Paceibacterota bacterium]